MNDQNREKSKRSQRAIYALFFFIFAMMAMVIAFGGMPVGNNPMVENRIITWLSIGFLATITFGYLTKLEKRISELEKGRDDGMLAPTRN